MHLRRLLLVLLLSQSAWAAHISLEPGQIMLSGEISRGDDLLFRQAATQPGIRRVVVDTPGGDLVTAMAIGDIIQQHQLDLTVRGLCFSACANYLFIAARHKTVEPDSFVGWHGGVNQYDCEEVCDDVALAQEVERLQRGPTLAMCRAQPAREAWDHRLRLALLSAMQTERSFYQKHGVNLALIRFSALVTGGPLLRSRRENLVQASDGRWQTRQGQLHSTPIRAFEVWLPHPADLKRLGVSGLESFWYPASLEKRQTALEQKMGGPLRASWQRYHTPTPEELSVARNLLAIGSTH